MIDYFRVETQKNDRVIAS